MSTDEEPISDQAMMSKTELTDASNLSKNELTGLTVKLLNALSPLTVEINDNVEIKSNSSNEEDDIIPELEDDEMDVDNQPSNGFASIPKNNPIYNFSMGDMIDRPYAPIVNASPNKTKYQPKYYEIYNNTIDETKTDNEPMDESIVEPIKEPTVEIINDEDKVNDSAIDNIVDTVSDRLGQLIEDYTDNNILSNELTRKKVIKKILQGAPKLSTPIEKFIDDIQQAEKEVEDEINDTSNEQSDDKVEKDDDEFLRMFSVSPESSESSDSVRLYSPKSPDYLPPDLEFETKVDENSESNEDKITPTYKTVSKRIYKKAPPMSTDESSIPRECNCESCQKRRESNTLYSRSITITPIMSYDRRFFPEPNRGISRMSRITWAYPKYTEELSVEEFQKYLDSIHEKEAEKDKQKLLAIEKAKENTEVSEILENDISDMETDTEAKKEITVDTDMNSSQNTNGENINAEIMQVEIETNNDGEEEIICPISIEPIEELAMTCYGHVYEKSVIQEWIMNHDTDPISGRYLFTKSLITKGIDRKNIRASQKKIRDNMLILSNYPTELLYPEHKVKEVNQMAQKIRNFTGSEEEEWKNYSINQLSYFRNPDAAKQTIPRNRYLNTDGDYPRPMGTGKDFEFLNLSGDYFNKFQHIGQNFKGASFNGADLSSNVFIQCYFNRCTFICANISAAVFHGCTFLGEEVNFAGASASEDTQFIDCTAEDVGDWSKWTDPQKVKLCFKNRLLTEPYSVISLGYDDF